MNDDKSASTQGHAVRLVCKGGLKYLQLNSPAQIAFD